MKAGILFGIALLSIAYILFTIFYMRSYKRKKLLCPIDESSGIEIVRDIQYKTGDSPLRMDLYKPAGYNSPIPVVILIHGDGFKLFVRDSKDWSMFSGYGRLLAANGFACVSFNHRTGSVATGYSRISDAAADILDLVSFIRKSASEWNIDVGRMGIWGFSSGSVYLNLFLKSRPEYVKCLLSFYGLLDAGAVVKRNREHLERFRPDYSLEDTIPETMPIFIVKAGRDSKAIRESTDRFMELAKSRGIRLDSFLHTEGRHGFDVLDNVGGTHEAITRALEFLKQYV